MSYFIPSSIQKRLLRYALSRVELLDTDALDLERLDIDWGRRSTVELRDVGLRKNKLRSLLDLPNHLDLEHASIAILRVTVPADIHTSAIIVEVTGIAAKLKLIEVVENDNPREFKKAKAKAGVPGKRRTQREVQFSTLHPAIPQEGSTLSSDDDEDRLPSAHDLAASFLAEERVEEKDQLEAAFASQSTADLRQSTLSTGSGDEEANMGTGLGVGLPNFLAAFLKGIGDRLQVKIRNVTIKLEASIDPTAASDSSHSGLISQEPTTIALFVDEIDICEVESVAIFANAASQSKQQRKPNNPATSESSTEKRRIILKRVVASLLLDSQLLSPSSPIRDEQYQVPFQASMHQEESSIRLPDSPQADVISRREIDEGATETEDDAPLMTRGELPRSVKQQNYFDSISSEVTDTASCANLEVTLADAPTSGVPSPNEQLLSELDDAIEQSVAYSRLMSIERADNLEVDPIESYPGYLHSSLKSCRDEKTPLISSSVLRARSCPSRSPSPPHSLSRSFSDSPSMEALNILQHRPSSPELSSSKSTETGRSANQIPDFLEPGKSDSHQAGSSMTQSMMFSHEEAESIYLSVIDESHSSISRNMHIPGAWDDSSDADILPDVKSIPDIGQPSQDTDLSSSQEPPKHNISRNSQPGSRIAGLQQRATVSGIVDPHISHMGHNASSPLPDLANQESILVRPFLRLDEAEFCISTSTDPGSLSISTPGAPQKARPSDQEQLSGSFSSYAESKSSTRSSGIASRTLPQRNINEGIQHKTNEVGKVASESLYELILHSVEAKIDVNTSRMFAELIRKFLSASNQSSSPNPVNSHKITSHQDSRESSSTFALIIDNIKVDILEVLESQALSIKHGISNEEWAQPTESPLFVLKSSAFEWNSKNLPTPQSKLDIGKLSFGFNDQDIISFSKQAKIRSSMRDLQSPSDKDISVVMGQIKNATEINVNTKPLQISLNLQRLDNTLGSMGGLSGLMELGSSVASESTIIAPSSKGGQRSKGVHFEKGLPCSETQKTTPKPRFNIRMGGAAVLIEGKLCSIKLHSTAIKLVGRDAIVGLQIDDMRLTGPYTSSQAADGGVTLRLKNTKLTYLHVPEEHDLTRLISLLTPSKDKFEDDDDFLVDTLIRQRRKGSVLRAIVAKIEFKVLDPNAVMTLRELFDEAAKMSAVTKYLPEESRPGLMTLGTIDHAVLEVETGHKVAPILVELKNAEFAHITLPSLIALSLGKVAIDRDGETAIITEVLPLDVSGQPPMLMARMIGDELEPTIKLKLWNLCFEYSVPLIMALLDIPEDTQRDDVSVHLSASIAALLEPRELPRSNTMSSNSSLLSNTKPLAFNIALRDCAIGLTPRRLLSKALFAVTDGCVHGALPSNEGLGMTIELRKAGLLISDDARRVASTSVMSLAKRSPSSAAVSNHIPDLCKLGYVSVSTISAATVVVKMVYGGQENPDKLDIDFKDELFLLETCADSTQTLIETLNDLKPPFPPSKGQKYRTEVTPVQDMMESFTGDAYTLGGPGFRNQADSGLDDISDEDLAREFDDLSDFTDMPPNVHPMLGDRLRGYSSAHLKSFSIPNAAANSLDHTALGRRIHGGKTGLHIGQSHSHVVGKKWDSSNNRYITVDAKELASCPIQLRIRDVHLIWHLFDGYDWEKTRDTITKAVQDVEAKAEERRFGRRYEDEDEKESVIGDFLFNSIYIGIPVNQDPQELTRQINRNLDDLVSETASHTSTANSRPSSSHRTPRNPGRKLKLERSKRHKVAFELRGLSADVFTFAPGGETQTSIDVRIADFEIFDHVPTSTWKKFATYMHDAGPRDEQKPMVHLELCDVKPVPELTATELVIRVTVLPVRLHVDQDALDFITRFFDFQDNSRSMSGPPAEQPYLQRVEVRAVPIKLDYKPKKVDYAGLRSGRTTEFMNFFILDGADMVLKHTIVYGTSGFVKLHKSLEDVWMPDIKYNQLPGVLSGLNGVRTLVNVGNGIKDLVVIPVREYKKDGRIVRSISKGAFAFARQTGGEITRIGAKLAIGAQTALQGAEDFFAGNQAGGGGEPGWENGDMDADERRAISHYANQPAGILQGLKGAVRSLERDLLVTKDIIIAVSGEARDSGTAEGAARAVVRHAPTLILRPMISASKAISQTLMGATNTVDPQNRRRVDDKYKRY